MTRESTFEANIIVYLFIVWTNSRQCVKKHSTLSKFTKKYCMPMRHPSANIFLTVGFNKVLLKNLQRADVKAEKEDQNSQIF